jgi:hypothetical protein
MEPEKYMKKRRMKEIEKAYIDKTRIVRETYPTRRSLRSE